jgi:hypothetical protein
MGDNWSCMPVAAGAPTSAPLSSPSGLPRPAVGLFRDVSPAQSPSWVPSASRLRRRSLRAHLRPGSENTQRKNARTEPTTPHNPSERSPTKTGSRKRRASNGITTAVAPTSDADTVITGASGANVRNEGRRNPNFLALDRGATTTLRVKIHQPTTPGTSAHEAMISTASTTAAAKPKNSSVTIVLLQP